MKQRKLTDKIIKTIRSEGCEVYHINNRLVIIDEMNNAYEMSSVKYKGKIKTIVDTKHLRFEDDPPIEISRIETRMQNNK